MSKKLPELLGLHCYAVNTHPDEFVPEPPKKIRDPPMNMLIGWALGFLLAKIRMHEPC